MRRNRQSHYTQAQKDEMWDRWQRGESMQAIARSFGRYHSAIQRTISRTGGFRPPVRKRAAITLSLPEREIISRGIAQDLSMRQIASELGRSPSTVCREINRNGGYDDYRATQADQAAWDRAHRPKLCKLVVNKSLARIVAHKLQLEWSPEQIAGWLKDTYPGQEGNTVSHETIYKSLFIQARGALKKELLAHLRTHRKLRRPKAFSWKGKQIGKIANTVSIRERPAAAEDRAVPGHWEGDLIMGSNKSYIATLVERRKWQTKARKMSSPH